MTKTYSISICIPLFKGASLLSGLIDNLYHQIGFDKFEIEILIGEDTPPEFTEEIKKTEDILKTLNDPRIKYIKNETNLGYARNLQKITQRAKKDILFLLAQDDILSADALQKTHDAFLLDENIGVVTRPYFWFEDEVTKPVRAVTPYNAKEDSIIDAMTDKKGFMKIFESVGQLSGLAYKRDLIEIPFNDEVFPAHIYPFAGILRKYKCAFLKDYTVAVGIKSSQTRSISSIYDLSPTLSWLKMYRTVFANEQFKTQRKWGEEHILTNYIGLVQLKNYAKRGVLEKEIWILIRERPLNLVSLRFWFFALGTILTPKFLLMRITDIYKSKVNSKFIQSIKFNEHN